MGQIASAKIPLSRMISPQLYWVMSDSEFTLDINNPEEPKILCVGNNPDRQNIYGAALGLYNSRIVKLINKKGMLKSSVIIDELPTIYFKGLDNLIATARSNKVAVCLGCFHLHQHADGRAYPAEQNFRLDAGDVRRFGVRQLQRAYQAEDFPL